MYVVNLPGERCWTAWWAHPGEGILICSPPQHFALHWEVVPHSVWALIRQRHHEWHTDRERSWKALWNSRNSASRYHFLSFFLLLKKVEAKIQGFHGTCLNCHMGLLINALKRGHWMHLLLHALKKKKERKENNERAFFIWYWGHNLLVTLHKN